MSTRILMAVDSTLPEDVQASCRAGLADLANYLGDIVLGPRDDVLPTGLPVEEGVRIILSAGNATPRQLPRA